MRRILAVLLTVCMLITPAVFATEETAEDNTKYYDVLTGLNIICGYEEFDLGSTMQRFEFINMVANLYGETGYSKVESADATEIAHAHGLIHSVEEFNPYAFILYEEAVKIAVCALGYSKLAEYQGGWPQGYLRVANRIDLLTGVEGTLGMPMTKGDLARLLYNTMRTPAMEQTVFGDTFEDYVVTEGVTLLSIYRDIYEVRDRFEGTEYTMLYSRSSLDKGEVSIGGKTYSYGKSVPDSYFGSTVEAYIRNTDFKDELICMTKFYPDDTVVIPVGNYVGVNDALTQLEYFDERDRKIIADLSKSMHVIYNGEFYADYTKVDFTLTDGSIMLTDSDDDNKYDVVQITAYDNMYVATVSATGRAVTGEFEYTGALNLLELNEDETDAKIRYLAPDGTPLTFDSIAPKQVLSVAQSKATSEPVWTIYISDTTVEGTVSTRKDTNKLLVDGVEYTLADSYLEANANGEELARLNIMGQKVLLYLDTFGKVAAAEIIGENRLHYAYATRMGKDGRWTPDVKIRVFESDGVWREYSFADKVTWNGYIEKAEDVYTALCGGGRLTPQLIGFELNSKSQISRLETGVFSGDTDRLIQGTDVTGMYTTTNRSFNWRVFLDSEETLVWIIPDDIDNEAAFSIGTHAYFAHVETYTITPYNLDEYKFAPMVVVEEGEAYFNTIKDTATLYIYLDTYTTMDTEGNEVQTIACSGGATGEVEFAVSESCTIPTLNRGDGIKISVNKNNMITHIERCYSMADLGKEIIPSNGFYTTELMAGYVKRVDYTKQRFTVECGGEQTLRNDVYGSGTTFIVNRNDTRNTIETCGFNQIEIGDYVVIRTQHSRLYDVYIIKNN